MSKRIVILTQYFVPEMGAPQSRLYETAKGLQQRGWEVMVVTAMPNYPTGEIFKYYRGKLHLIENMEGMELLRYTLYASNATKALPRIVSMLSFSFTSFWAWRKICRFRPQYVFTESPPLTLGLTGLALARLSGARHILNVSDLWPLSAYELGAISKGKVYRLLERLERFLYSHSFACTGQSAQIVKQLHVAGSRRTHLYRNGVDTNRFQVSDNVRHYSNGKPLRIVYAGLLGVAQGILGLCSNIDFSANGAELHVYGAGAERQAIEAFLRQYPNRGITLHQPVDRVRMPVLLTGYDATIIPLVKPIFGAVPSKIYEAMAAGLPIIFAGGGEGADIVKEHEVGHVCTPGNYQEIIGAVRNISLMDEKEYMLIRANCINAARHVFDRNIQIDGLDAFLVNNMK